MTAALVIIAIVLYFVPTMIAIDRKHNNLVPIIVINIFFGWVYGIGWIIALIWSLSNGSQVASVSSNKSESSGQQNDIAEQLVKLSSLKSSGILTEMEFLELKNKLLYKNEKISDKKDEDKINPSYIPESNPVNKMIPVSDKNKMKNNQSNTLLLPIIGVTTFTLLILLSIYFFKLKKSSQVDVNATEVNATEMYVTDANATEANINITGEAEESCYDLGYKYGGCAHKSSLGLPCDTGTDFIMPERCRDNADTERGISDSVFSQQYNTETTQSPPLATSSEATDESIIFGVVKGLNPNGDGFLSIRNKNPEEDKESREIGRLYNGDTVNIISKHGVWYKIQSDDGLIGYSHSNWIKIQN